MRAVARVVAEADRHGRTRVIRLRGEVPLVLRQGPASHGAALVRLVGGAAGPLGGDDLRLDLEVRENAVLTLRTVAASVVLPARSGGRSRMVVTATVAAGGVLRWLPEQLVATAGCRHESRNTVRLEDGASLLWRDELVCGRHGEEPGDTVLSTSVCYAGRPLLRQSLAVGPSAVGWAGCGVLGGAKATGSLLHAGLAVSPHIGAPGACRMPLAGPGWLLTATAPDAHSLRRLLCYDPDGRV